MFNFYKDLQIPIKIAFPKNYPKTCPYFAINAPNGFRLCAVYFM